MSKLAVWMRLSNRQRFMLAEAAFALIFAQLAVRLCFPLIARWAMRPRAADDPVPPVPLGRSIRTALQTAARNLPWESVCLPQALAARMLLARRGYTATIHLGVGQSQQGFIAHAWLDAGGGQILTGGDGMEGLSTIL